MNYRLVGKLLGIICFLIGLTMLFCLPWAFPALGRHTDSIVDPVELEFEGAGFLALGLSTLISFAVAGLFWITCKNSKGQIFLREAMAIVGLSWILATILGALPFLISNTCRSCSVRVFEGSNTVYVSKFNWNFFDEWSPVQLTQNQSEVLKALVKPPEKMTRRKVLGLTPSELAEATRIPEKDVVGILTTLGEKPGISSVLIPPTSREFPDSPGHYRLRWVRMGVIDSLFEAQSGFSTTGATVIGHLEDPLLVPHCILFWRSMTHFLGGLGIIVLFVVVLGEGSAGKALMRNEVPGPIDSNPTTRMRHAAMLFTGTYCGLNALLAILLLSSGHMNAFDSITHAFATMATGGFSNYDSSLGHFDSSFVQYTVVVFMILAGTNFTLLFLLARGKAGPMLRDPEWRTYIILIFGLTALVISFGMLNRDAGFETLGSALRVALFQVVSIITTTGFGTNDFDQWNSFGRGILLLLMFVGGCAGSTGGGMKVIRHILFVKILRVEIEKSYHPRVIRKIQIGGKPLEDPNIPRNILVYFALILILFCAGWLYVVAFEPGDTWGAHPDNKLLDSASAVSATLNNIGPGLGTVGSSQNYGHFSSGTKFVFIWLMMLGRLELFVVLVLFVPRFWRGYS
ncbi:MAG: TrkH family potassium uptake protein [Planctomycetota bacterium]|nr:TrkH family potassium uptake protein [Planctomycetota bacterium]